MDWYTLWYGLAGFLVDNASRRDGHLSAGDPGASAGVLDCKFPVAMEVPDRGDCWIANCSSPYRSWFLCLNRIGPAQSIGKVVAGTHWTPISLHLRRPGDRIGSL